MRIYSPSFEDNGFIPKEFSYEEGDCINPELDIIDAPERTKSFVLIMRDIDAPHGGFIHWIVFNIPPDATVIEEDSIPGKQGKNDAKRKNYTGPRTPFGETHRYRFTVYALDTILDLPEGEDRNKIINSMKEHVLVEAGYTGKYKR